MNPVILPEQVYSETAEFFNKVSCGETSKCTMNMKSRKINLIKKGYPSMITDGWVLVVF